MAQILTIQGNCQPDIVLIATISNKLTKVHNPCLDQFKITIQIIIKTNQIITIILIIKPKIVWI